MDNIDFGMIREKLEEEREQTEWLNARLRERMWDRKRSYHKGFAGMDQQT